MTVGCYLFILLSVCEGDRSGSVKRKTPETLTPNELKEKNKLIETEKTETGSVSFTTISHRLSSTKVFSMTQIPIIHLAEGVPFKWILGL